jgi:hypothetical protein
MNKRSPLPTLTLRRASLRPLIADDDLRQVVGGRRDTLTSSIGTRGSHCDPMCVSEKL